MCFPQLGGAYIDAVVLLLPSEVSAYVLRIAFGILGASICEVVGYLISDYSYMARDPGQPGHHRQVFHQGVGHSGQTTASGCG